jgi:hypothetical protein
MKIYLFIICIDNEGENIIDFFAGNDIFSCNLMNEQKFNILMQKVKVFMDLLMILYFIINLIQHMN